MISFSTYSINKQFNSLALFLNNKIKISGEKKLVKSLYQAYTKFDSVLDRVVKYSKNEPRAHSSRFVNNVCVNNMGIKEAALIEFAYKKGKTSPIQLSSEEQKDFPSWYFKKVLQAVAISPALDLLSQNHPKLAKNLGEKYRDMRIFGNSVFASCSSKDEAVNRYRELANKEELTEEEADEISEILEAAESDPELEERLDQVDTRWGEEGKA